MLIVRHLGTPNSDFNGCHCMRDPELYRSMVHTSTYEQHTNNIGLHTSTYEKHISNIRVHTGKRRALAPLSTSFSKFS